jgi:hypothetical protein
MILMPVERQDIEHAGELGVPVTDQELPCPCVLAEAGQ